MKFEQQVTTDSTRAAMWALLSDIPTVARCVPGVEDVQQVDPKTYQGVVRFRLGPIGLNLSGTVEVQQDESQGHLNMTVQAKDQRLAGGIRAIVEATLTEVGPSSVGLKVSSDVQFMGRLGELGQPLIKRKIDSLFKEFAENLKKVAAQES
jgi:carbon monoxide dehydrogenase subunit G